MSRGEHTVDTFTHNGYKVDIIYDQDCESPRHNDGNFLFISFPARDAIKADEELDPETHSFECPDCAPHDDSDCVCERCERDGTVYAQTLTELIELVKVEYKAHLVLPVARSEHGPNCEYSITHSDEDRIPPWVYGLILDTPDTLEERGFPTPLTEAWLREGMEAEIDEYSKWANGECYGYVITDRNGDEVDACWGFIGHEYVEEEVKRQLADLPPQPSTLYDVRLTKQEIDEIVDRLGNQHEAHQLSGVAKLAAIDTDEEDE